MERVTEHTMCTLGKGIRGRHCFEKPAARRAQGITRSYSDLSNASFSGSSENSSETISACSFFKLRRRHEQTKQWPRSLVSMTSISYPASSKNSLFTASSALSPSSMVPPGISHPLRLVLNTIKKRGPLNATPYAVGKSFPPESDHAVVLLERLEVS